MMFLEGTPDAFLGVRPEWTLEGVKLPCESEAGLDLEQRPFQWAHGVWETEVVARAKGAADNLPHRVIMRIAPDTVRRWKEVGINPFLEACAQLREHLARKRHPGELSLLILL